MNKMKTLTLQGVTFEVVDEQARADIDVLKENSGSGGASSWNDLTDKPFGETTVMGDTLTWDGNTEGKLIVADAICKVSDIVITPDDIANGYKITMNDSGTVMEQEFDGSEYDDLGSAIMLGDGSYVCVIEDNAVIGESEMIFTEKGMYVPTAYASAAPMSLTIPGYKGFEATVIKPIETKYLPESIGKVKTVNGVEPDENGNVEVEVEFPETSWNDLTDKPFGETKAKGDTLTWDGNIEGLVSMDAFAEIVGTLYKISDAVPTLEDCISGATYTVAYNGEQKNLSVGYDEIAEMSSFCGCLCIGDFYAMVAPENNFQIEIEGVTAIFPEAGLYTPIGGDVILTSLTIPGYNGFETTAVKPIDTKYLPEHLQFGEIVVKGNTLTWDGNTDGLAVLELDNEETFYQVSDTPPALADFAHGCTVYFGGIGYGFAYEDIEAHVQRSGMFYGESWVYLPQDISADGMTIAKGLYFMNSAADGYVTSFTIHGYTGFETTTIKRLDEAYMPILTSPSGKKFKLSVDDSGVLSATEVTE